MTRIKKILIILMLVSLSISASGLPLYNVVTCTVHSRSYNERRDCGEFHVEINNRIVILKTRYLDVWNNLEVGGTYVLFIHRFKWIYHYEEIYNE